MALLYDISVQIDDFKPVFKVFWGWYTTSPRLALLKIKVISNCQISENL
jgi:hypothetical protein